MLYSITITPCSFQLQLHFHFLRKLHFYLLNFGLIVFSCFPCLACCLVTVPLSLAMLLGSGVSRVGLRGGFPSHTFKWLVKVGASKCVIRVDLKKIMAGGGLRATRKPPNTPLLGSTMLQHLISYQCGTIELHDTKKNSKQKLCIHFV